MGNLLKYSAVLWSGLSDATYDATTFFADSNAAAIERAKAWAASLQRVPADARLQLSANGIGISAFDPGKF